MSNYDKYYDEELKEKKKATDEAVAKRKEDDAALKGQINATYDAAAESAAGVYREEMAKAPLDSRALYDQNAMREAIDRKKIQETLANMGMTDSGLSSSMHTALTVQKSRADNQVRADEKARIRAAESEIDRIFANNEIQKSQKGIEIDQATTEWERNQRANDEALASQNATARVNADVEAATEQQKMAMDIHNKRAAMAQQFMEDGKESSEAWGMAYKAYPDTSTAEGVKYAYYGQLRTQGYASGVANAASTAYVNAVTQRSTEAEAQRAEEYAMKTAYDGYLDRFGLSFVRNGTLPSGIAEIINEANRYMQGGVPADVAAYACGMRFAATVLDGDDATADQIGKLLAQCFSGTNLSAALLAAGVE